MPSPSLSIVTPSYNQLGFLKACIASIEIQAYPEVEHLVLDGGSQDGTAQFLEDHPDRVTWWRSHPDRGQSHALNEGFSRATGDWIGWQNSDDFYFPGAFWILAHCVEQHPEVGVVVGDAAIADEYGVMKHLIGVSPVPPRIWLHGYWPYNQAVFIRRDVLEKAGPIDESLHIHLDTDLLARIALLEPRVAYINHPLGAFRKYAGTKTESAEQIGRIRLEREILEARYGRKLWPLPGFDWQRHRITHHAWTFRTWGFSALIGRLGQRISRRMVEHIAIR